MTSSVQFCCAQAQLFKFGRRDGDGAAPSLGQYREPISGGFSEMTKTGEHRALAIPVDSQFCPKTDKPTFGHSVAIQLWANTGRSRIVCAGGASRLTY